MKLPIPKQRWLATAIVAAALLTTSALASATVMHYATRFTTLNDSGVTGKANVWYNDETDKLTVSIHASGLLPNQTHVQHIHGTFDSDGNPTQATTPGIAQDANGDGVLEVTEGAATYGPILLPLVPFQTAADGTIDYMATFDLSDPSIYFGGATASDLFPLNFREIVIHGLIAPIDITNGGLDGATFFAAGTYDPFIPVASGVLAVPEPADLGMLAGGLGLLMGLLWLRRRVDDSRVEI